MMKKLLLLLSLIVFTGCQTSGGYGSNPWDRPGTDQQAQSAPHQLTKQALLTPPEQAAEQTPEKPGQGTQAPVGGTTTYRNNNEPLVRENLTAPSGYESSEHTTLGSETTPYKGLQTEEPVTAVPTLPPVKVALLLPLTGKHGDLGQSMLKAAQLALFDMGYTSFELMPRDTKGTPDGAGKAIRSAINDGAQMILGPLFASSVRAAKPVAQRYNINMIAFSTDWTLAGGNTYIMGFLPFAQVQRIAAYASQNGLHRIGILAPNTEYGNAVIAAYNSAAYRNGLESADVVRFPADESDISNIVREFADYDNRVEALNRKVAETEALLKNNPGDRALKKELEDLESMQTWGDPPFDGVLLPVGGEQARAIANLLSFYDLDPRRVKRLGTGLWDDPSLATETALHEAWFAASSPDSRTDFERRYRNLYSARPVRLATLSYDATALAAVLARNGYYNTGKPAFNRESLTNPNGFAGIDGIFRFRPDGLVERGLAILKFDNAGIVVLDPPPQSFLQASY